MGKFRIIIVYCVIFFSLFSGCGKTAPNRPLALVTGIQATCTQDGELLQRRYTDPEKITAVLHYLLRLKPYATATNDPERVKGSSYRIEVLLSDGTLHVYRQRANRYLSKDCRVWQLIDPQRGAELYPLLQNMESDAP